MDFFQFFSGRKSNSPQRSQTLSYVACQQLNVVNMGILGTASAFLVAIGTSDFIWDRLTHGNADLILTFAMFVLVSAVFASIVSIWVTFEAVQSTSEGSRATVYTNIAGCLLPGAIVLIAFVAALEMRYI